ncbi:uncharacterized protein A4U43_C05F17380 [Asparagus officinalis]|uniref:Glycosyl transferase family 1 domain-containing protein n=1 Tax=Asparagus officinalis TaxID=4686 RepID=A0A5P1EUT2_ASPOF|nr:uncharacterized protein A4U43_C05F17380 [Asparagus officinalis]
MGSLESGIPLKRTPLLRSSPSSGSNRSFFHRPVETNSAASIVDYIQWICTAAAFFFVVILFQASLPGSVVEKSGGEVEESDGAILKGIRGLDFGEGISFMPTRLMEKWERERREANATSLGREVKRFGLKRPKIALVVAGLWADGVQLEMVSVAAALKEIGYDIQVYSLKDGPIHAAWKTLGMPCIILSMDIKCEVTVDWSDYNGIIISSIDARPAISCLLQEPFKSIPVIWIIHEYSLALHLNKYTANGQSPLISDWKQAFNRAAVVVFPTYSLPVMYSTFDAGNYFVIPSSATEAWRARVLFPVQSGHDLRAKMGFGTEDFLIAVVGSQFSYSGMWLEYALVLQALAPVFKEMTSEGTSYIPLKVGISSVNSSDAHKMALETMTLKVGYPGGSVQLIACNTNEINFLGTANLVIYGSFLEEQSFPPVLLQAMNLGKLVVAPDLNMIKKHINDKVNGFLYSKEDVGMLKQILLQAISGGNLSPLAQEIAAVGREHAKNLMVPDTIHSYASLLENVIKFPSEIATPKAVEDMASGVREEWQWHLFENFTDVNNLNKALENYGMVDKIEEQWNQTHNEGSTSTSRVDEAFSSITWEEEKMIEAVNARKRIEEEELKSRTDQYHGTWEDVYRNAKRADRAKNELHERDDRELERTGQPLCIYEPYLGEGTWPFLHNTSLYRGIGLYSKGRRRGADDIDASSRLPLLVDSYYRDVLGEYGAFFALANRIDRIHKNAWIGFQSWKAVARKESLSVRAEAALLEDIQGRRHGDALYFWVRMDKDPRNPLRQDFWSFCDAINAGSCRFAVSEALRRMYGIDLKHNLDTLPLMPEDGDSWSVMHSWALPTRSFLEFVMFSRMFVDAMDAEMYDQHHQSGYCYLSLTKDRQCYSRVLELLVNVWAYHSARRMISVDPETGAMQEHHKLKNRRGHMWVKWFSFATLKSMDEELAEELDVDHPHRRWLWPLTGEVFWQGMYERERNMRHQQKERRRQQSKDKIQRIRKRARQKTLGKYIKPPPETTGDLNATKTH